MFDISWTEFLLVGVVALIVIGPKELPGVLRTLGQYTRKMRAMAADFQSQFQEAMREAEMVDLKKQVDDMAQDLKGFDPLKGVREDIESTGKDIKASLEAKPAAERTETAAATVAALPETMPIPAAEFPLPEAAIELGDENAGSTAAGPVTPEAANDAAEPNKTERTG
jgi:sec-independent protein translocase protein TatB